MKADLAILKLSHLTNSGLIARGSQENPIELLQYQTDRIGLMVKERVGTGLLVNIESVLIMDKARHAMPMTGKIVKCDKVSERAFSIQVELHHYDQPLWASFLKMQNQEQDRVQRLLIKLRGDE